SHAARLNKRNNVTSMALRAIHKDIIEMERNPPEECYAECVNMDEEPHFWQAMFKGPEASPYAGGMFYMSIWIGADYPYQAPIFKFTSPIYHPGINSRGEMLLPVVERGWGPDMSIRKAILAIHAYLADNNADDPLRQDIAKQYRYEREKFNETAQAWTRKYAQYDGPGADST
ncbi:unnamed protein product, partial [Meganyctiphanes norvegica]